MIPYAEVIGDPIAHSKSPLIHRFWLDALGLAGDYRATRVTADALPAWLAERRSDPVWRGCNVTMPLKRAVVPFAATLDRAASVINTVNTLVHRSDRRIDGFNTDVVSITGALSRAENAIGNYPDHVATYTQIIGSGGAARAAGLAGLAASTDIDFFARDIAKAKALAEEFGLPEWFGSGLAGLGPIRNPGDGPEDQRYSHIVINATPMGMAGKPSVPIDLSAYYPDTIVFDMVYFPLETPLLKEARALGLRTIDGLDMLIGQAAVAFELFFGSAPPRERDAELRAVLTA